MSNHHGPDKQQEQYAFSARLNLVTNFFIIGRISVADRVLLRLSQLVYF